MRFGLTGITSGIGLPLAESLMNEGHEVAGLVRDPERADARALGARGVRIVKGSLHDAAALADVARGADVFVHLAAQVGDIGDVEDFVRVNVGGTAAAVQAAAEAGVGRFLHLSSTSVYGWPDSGRIDESWPTRYAGVPYDDTKTDAERLALRLGETLGIEVVVIRPPGIYGPHDRNFLPRAVTALKKRQFVFIAGGAAPLTLVWVGHVVEVVALAAKKEGIAGEAFNVVDDVDHDPPSVREIANTIADAVGAPRPAFSMPYAFALGLSHLVETGYRAAGVEDVPPFTPFVVRILTRRAVIDATKATRVLGFRPRKRSIDGIREQALAYAARMR